MQPGLIIPLRCIARPCKPGLIIPLRCIARPMQPGLVIPLRCIARPCNRGLGHSRFAALLAHGSRGLVIPLSLPLLAHAARGWSIPLRCIARPCKPGAGLSASMPCAESFFPAWSPRRRKTQQHFRYDPSAGESTGKEISDLLLNHLILQTADAFNLHLDFITRLKRPYPAGSSRGDNITLFKAEIT